MREDVGIQVDAPQVRIFSRMLFARLWTGEAENDGFNRWCWRRGCHGATWRCCAPIAGICCKLAFPFSQAYMERTLSDHPSIARMLVDLFHARFAPGPRRRERHATAPAGDHRGGAGKVSSLDEDRILRRFLNIIQATPRTNFFQTDPQGTAQGLSVLQVRSHPHRRTAAAAPDVRDFCVLASGGSGAPARRTGGARRSALVGPARGFPHRGAGPGEGADGENAVIVPVGAKGGFVLKQPPTKREDRDAGSTRACCHHLHPGLLDITDNRGRRRHIVAPPRWSATTATIPIWWSRRIRAPPRFPTSPTAFPPITASGWAMPSPRGLRRLRSQGNGHHRARRLGVGQTPFPEMGKDIQTRDDFTVVGIGDMSGDVFGNGMLLSRHPQGAGGLQSPHVFIDPNPDPEASFRERERLFALPRSSWDDYDKSLIVGGGSGIPPPAKSIVLSPETRAALGIRAERLTPNELVPQPAEGAGRSAVERRHRHLRQGPAENHSEVGDRANDAIRINGDELRCKVVGKAAIWA